MRVAAGHTAGAATRSVNHADAQAGLLIPLTLSEATDSPVTVTYWTAPVTTTTTTIVAPTTVAAPQISNVVCQYGGFMSTCTITGSGFNNVMNIYTLRGDSVMWGRNSNSQITLYLVGYVPGFYEFFLEPTSGKGQPFAVRVN